MVASRFLRRYEVQMLLTQFTAGKGSEGDLMAMTAGFGGGNPKNRYLPLL